MHTFVLRVVHYTPRLIYLLYKLFFSIEHNTQQNKRNLYNNNNKYAAYLLFLFYLCSLLLLLDVLTPPGILRTMCVYLKCRQKIIFYNFSMY
jgi:hypothetical protein